MTHPGRDATLMTEAPRLAAPVHVRGPDGPWHEVRESLQRRGNAVVHTNSGEWPTAVTAEPRLRHLLGRDWQHYRRTADPAARHRFAAARLVLKYTAAAALGTKAAELDLAYKIGGRPYLRGLRGVDVGLTHTGDLIAVGISRVGRIGIDAEPLSRALFYDVLLDRVCTPAEQAVLQYLDGPERTAAMLRLWTLKEAYTKALGQGLRLRFGEFDLAPGIRGDVPAGHDGGLLAPDGTPACRGAWAFGTYRVLGRWLLSVAAHGHGSVSGIPARGIVDERSMTLVTRLLSEEAAPPRGRIGPAQRGSA
ncbi:4'-phosphopantetheinyl transferase superfamily protein [Streptomyces sp. NPDC000151]|uniref:4'-phosphopantetheinyl transferase family protein n=1 Tax=Streptomyces sp. NPDC000151 TaxID=3154244 RepID=UPI00332F999E